MRAVNFGECFFFTVRFDISDFLNPYSKLKRSTKFCKWMQIHSFTHTNIQDRTTMLGLGLLMG